MEATERVGVSQSCVAKGQGPYVDKLAFLCFSLSCPPLGSICILFLRPVLAYLLAVLPVLPVFVKLLWFLLVSL